MLKLKYLNNLIMKHFKILIIAATMFAAIACTKSDEQINSTDSTVSAVVENDGIECIDGTLHFANGEVCLKTIESLTSESALHEFEKAHNFYSWRSFADLLLNDIAECETPEEYQIALETSNGYLKEDAGRLMPVIASVGYASIADLDGVFYVGGVKHTVKEKTISIETTDAITRAVNVEELDYLAPIGQNGQTRAEDEAAYTDLRRETDKYKVFARTNILRHTVAEQVNGQTVYTTSFDIQVHVSGQKKKFLIGWNTYKDRFYVENLHWDLTIYETRISYLKHVNNYSASDYTTDFYVVTRFGTGAFDKAPIVIPMPKNFNCLVHRVRSESIGSCGVLTNISNNILCESATSRIPECI